MTHSFISMYFNYCWSLRHTFNVVQSKNLTHFDKTPSFPHTSTRGICSQGIWFHVPWRFSHRTQRLSHRFLREDPQEGWRWRQSRGQGLAPLGRENTRARSSAINRGRRRRTWWTTAPARRGASSSGRGSGSLLPCATADAPPRKRRPPPKGESPRRRAGVLLDINMLVLALLFITDLPVGQNSVRQRIQQASISRLGKKIQYIPAHTGTYQYVLLKIILFSISTSQYVPVCTCLFCLMPILYLLVLPCTVFVPPCTVLYRLVPSCTVLYCVGTRWYKTVHTGTYFWDLDYVSTYWYVPKSRIWYRDRYKLVHTGTYRLVQVYRIPDEHTYILLPINL